MDNAKVIKFAARNGADIINFFMRFSEPSNMKIDKIIILRDFYLNFLVYLKNEIYKK